MARSLLVSDHRRCPGRIARRKSTRATLIPSALRKLPAVSRRRKRKTSAALSIRSHLALRSAAPLFDADVRNPREGLDIAHQRRPIIEAVRFQLRRHVARFAATVRHSFDERALFAANVAARTNEY